MYYETSYKAMVGEERALWEELIPQACELMDILYETDENNFKLSRYINVLFGLRSAKVDHDYLMGIRNEIYGSSSRYYVDKFMLQKTIKDYLGNIDSALDYLQQLLGAFTAEGGKSPFWFERGKLEFDQRISDMRNEVMHEGVLSLNFDPGRPLMNTCHCDVAGSVDKPPTIRVRFNLNGEGKWEELGYMVTHTYCETRKLIADMIKELCTCFKKGY